MACERLTKEINGQEYATVQLAPSVALPKMGKVIKLCGPILGLIAQATKSAVGKDAKGKEAAVMDAVHSMAAELASIDPDGLTAVVKDLCCQAWFGGKKISYDEHFAEYPADLFQVAWFVLQSNGRRFLPGKLPDFGKKKAAE